jgi:Tol biopolymer transport system component
MPNYPVLFLLTVLFVNSCAPAPVDLTRPPTVTATEIVFPSSTPRSSQTATPTSSIYPPLQTQGPYLLFTRDNKKLTLADMDGRGWRQIQLPNDGYIFLLDQSISPDGKWLAYFAGSVQEPYDLTLNLLHLSDETTRIVSSLLASDFPANLKPIVEAVVLDDLPIYDAYCLEDLECRQDLVQNELTNSLFRFDWSPNSQSIAFTAQIDGPSSDIYIYNLQDESIHPLTREPENIYWLDWAPNGLSMLYQISSPFGTSYEGSSWRLIRLAGEEISFSESLASEYFRWDGHDWISENSYLLLIGSDTQPSQSNFRVLNTDTGQVTDIWPHSAEFFALNPEHQAVYLAFKHYPGQISLPAEGIYIVEANGEFRRIIDSKHILISFAENQGPYPVLGVDYEGRVYDMRYDGSSKMLAWPGHPLPFLSPDGKLLLYREYKQLALYTDSYELIKSWPMEAEVHNVAWHPDSLGFFIFTGTKTYFQAISDEQPGPVLDECSPKCETDRFVWPP